MNNRTFQNSDEALAYLQSVYGSTNYRDWQSVRKQWYSSVTYPEAGSNQISFFGNVAGQGTTTIQDTNLQKAGSFGQNHFLRMAVRFDFRIANYDLNRVVDADADTLYSDVVAGFVQAGLFQLDIGAKSYIQIPRPFMYAPPADGRVDVRWNGARSGALATQVSSNPHAELNGCIDNLYRVDPMILIEAEQSFVANLLYPTGAVPIIGSDVTDDSTNPLKVICTFDGILYRPVQ